MRYNMLGAPQAKILWSAPSKSRFYYLFWLLELMPGHLRRSILRILVLNPTHEISWSRSGFFSLRGRILRAGPPGPPCFLVFVFSPPPSALEVPGLPLSERSKTLRPTKSLSNHTNFQQSKLDAILSAFRQSWMLYTKFDPILLIPLISSENKDTSGWDFST